MPTPNTISTITPRMMQAARQMGAFCIELSTDSLTPRYHSGDILKVDVSAQPNPGDGVIVQMKQSGQYAALLYDADGSVYNFTGQRFLPARFDIIGAVVEVFPG